MNPGLAASSGMAARNRYKPCNRWQLRELFPGSLYAFDVLLRSATCRRGICSVRPRDLRYAGPVFHLIRLRPGSFPFRYRYRNSGPKVAPDRGQVLDLHFHSLFEETLHTAGTLSRNQDGPSHQTPARVSFEESAADAVRRSLYVLHFELQTSACFSSAQGAI